MRELAAQFAAEQQIVKVNQHDPLRQTDDADEEDRQENAAHDVSSERRVVLFVCVSRRERGISAATIAATAVSPSNQ
jgi:hypothetical protein